MKLIEDKHYYDNTFVVDAGMLSVDRVYMVDEYRFRDEDYEKLGEIYSSLPNFLGSHPCPTWFGLDDNERGTVFLWVSFEPSGLQFCGYLKYSDFMVWEEKLHDLLEKSGLPFKI